MRGYLYTSAVQKTAQKINPARSFRKFKNWSVPGAKRTLLPSQENETLADDISLDAISGDWQIFQYKKGHRYSTDDVLTAWYGTTKAPSASRILDLGSGISSVALMAAWRTPGATIVTIEAQQISFDLAKRSILHNGLKDRFDQRLGDFRDPALFGDQTEPFDLVLGSPPYFPLGTGVLGDHPQTIPCRFEVRGDISDYAKTAARHLGPCGVFACVFPAEQKERVYRAAQAAALRIWSQRDVVLKEGNPPLLTLFAMSHAEDLPPDFALEPWTEPALVIRTKTGETHPEYKTIKLTMGFRP